MFFIMTLRSSLRQRYATVASLQPNLTSNVKYHVKIPFIDLLLNIIQDLGVAGSHVTPNPKGDGRRDRTRHGRRSELEHFRPRISTPNSIKVGS